MKKKKKKLIFIIHAKCFWYMNRNTSYRELCYYIEKKCCLIVQKEIFISLLLLYLVLIVINNFEFLNLLLIWNTISLHIIKRLRCPCVHKYIPSIWFMTSSCFIAVNYKDSNRIIMLDIISSMVFCLYAFQLLIQIQK